MGEMMTQGTAEQVAGVTWAFISMNKFDSAVLERADEGE
jgi:hypothetical protein